MTQKRFAEKIGISIQGLSNIERNRYQPTAETVDKICKAFKITPIELLSTASDENVKNLILLLLSCPKNRLAKIHKIINILIKIQKF